MATETINLEVKSNVGQVTKETEGLVQNFKVMGVSLNDIKKSFGNITSVARKSFSTIKAGIAATGIGALIIAFGSLFTFLTKTKEGAETLERAFSGISAAFKVLIDRISTFGGSIVKLFRGDFKGAVEDLRATFSSLGDEIREETRAAIELTRQLQALKDADRSLRVETAQRRAEIERLKLVAEDTTKSEQERLKAAKDAFSIEQQLLDKRLENAEEAVRIQKEQMSMSKNLEEDLDKLAELEINLANISQESTTKQIELNNKINQINNEAELKRQEAAAKKKADEDAELERLEKLRQKNEELLTQQLADIEALSNFEENFANERALREADDERKRLLLQEKIRRDNQLNQLKDLKEFGGIKAKLEGEILEDSRKKQEAINKRFDNLEKQQKIGAVQELGSALGQLAGKNKEVAVAEAIINTYQGATKALAQGGIFGVVSAAAVVANGLNSVKQIMAQDVGTGTGGGGGGASASFSNVGATDLAPQMTSGQFTLGTGEAPEPIQAFVVSDDITQSQNKLANIRRRATI